MEARRYGTNMSALAEYSDGKIDAGTARAWRSRGTRPSYANVIALADVLKRPRAEALAAAGYEIEGSNVEDRTEPTWVQRLVNEILNVEPPLTPSEARLVEAQVRGLLQFREERAAYEASPPEAPQPPHPA